MRKRRGRLLTRLRLAVAAAALCTAAACGVDYRAAPVGRFDGSLLVMWLGEGDASGDGRFLFVPSPGRPLTFERTGPGNAPQVIQPEMMYTDGGSIPRIGQVFRGFSPWGYAPAYMIHDWLFVARHCNLDGMATEEERKVADMSFRESAQIVAEAIKTLVEAGRVQPNDVAATVIPNAVAGSKAKEIWNRKGACRASRVSRRDRAAALAAIAAPQRRSVRILGVTVTPARIVDEVSFPPDRR